MTDEHRSRARRRPSGGPVAREADHRAVAGPAAGPLAREPNQAPADRAGAPTGRVLVVGCGALARELVALADTLPGVDVACLPPELHNRPEKIPVRVRDRVNQARREGYANVFVAYADCGTGGLLDPVLRELGVERLAGAHCYEFFAGHAEFAQLADDEPATFWLTDFLARNFERLVIRGLGIDRHPELQDVYFANYRRVVYLAQTDDPDLLRLAERAAERLGLAFEHRHTGLGELETSILALGAPPSGARRASAGDVPGAKIAASARGTSPGGTHARRMGEDASQAVIDVASARTPSATTESPGTAR